MIFELYRNRRNDDVRWRVRDKRNRKIMANGGEGYVRALDAVKAAAKVLAAGDALVDAYRADPKEITSRRGWSVTL